MTDKRFDELQNVDQVEEGYEEEDETEFDDAEYTPAFIQKVLDDPELLPHQIREDFVWVFEEFEYSHLGRAKTTYEYILVNEAAKLVLGLQHLDRLENAILTTVRRPALESLMRKTHEAAPMKGAEAAIRGSAVLRATQYFTDPAFKVKSDREFEAAGYGPDALESEAYLRSLSSLTVIHRQKAADRKALFSILRELEARFTSRHPEKKITVKKTKTRSSK
jgi:hypothetical protein